MFNRATYLLAFVLLARLKLIADFFALIVFNFLYFFCCHNLLLQVISIMQLIARNKSFIFAAATFLLYKHFASSTVIVMTLLLALVSHTREEFLADSLAHWYFVSTFPTFFS